MRVRRPRTLRARVVVLLLVLNAVALGGAGAASVVALRSYLVQELDTRLVRYSASVPNRADQLRNRDRLGHETAVPSDFQVVLFDRDGERIATFGNSDGPELTPGTLAALNSIDRPVNLPAPGPAAWRALAVALPGGSAVVSLPLAPVRATIAELVTVELIVGCVALTALAAIAAGLVRVGLRPLSEIERTAQAIAGGDLDRRVRDTNPRSEIGRLGAAINVMLGQIATALRQREASEETMRQFVADASHELRTPLTSIRGFAELCGKRDATGDQVAHGLARIEAEATRMSGLVEDLLLLAALNARRPLERSGVDLLVLAVDAVDDARARDPARSVTVGGNMRSLIVDGDESRLRQVLANLLGNALIHTPPDTPVSVILRPNDSALPLTASVGAPPPDERVELEVRDFGPGMDAAQASRIFDRFYRADPGRGRSTGGTGLGLSIAAAIVTAHGGRLELRTAPGAGAAFRVLLPVERPPVA